jgi:hypothetical protein
VLLATGVLGTLMSPFVVGVASLIETLTGVNLPGV